MNNKLKSLKLRIRDSVNKITGKQKVIDDYFKVSQEIAELGVKKDQERDPVITEKINNLYQRVTDTKFIQNGESITIDSYDPYKGSKKETQKRTEMGVKELKELKGMKRGDTTL